jgi:hypothetical protein
LLLCPCVLLQDDGHPPLKKLRNGFSFFNFHLFLLSVVNWLWFWFVPRVCCICSIFLAGASLRSTRFEWTKLIKQHLCSNKSGSCGYVMSILRHVNLLVVSKTRTHWSWAFRPNHVVARMCFAERMQGVTLRQLNIRFYFLIVSQIWKIETGSL